MESLERKEWAQGLFCCHRKHIFSLQANSHPEQYQRSTRKCSTGISMFALLGKYGVPIAIAWGVVKLAKCPRASSRLRRRKRLAVRSEELVILAINASIMILSFRLQKGNMGKLQQQNHGLDFILQIFCPSCSTAAVPLRIRGSACPARTCKRHQKTLKRWAMAVTLLQNWAI